MSDIVFSVDIPADDEGYVLFCCPKCGEYFKIKPEDFYADEIKEIYCPQCGLTSDSYLTSDVVELGLAMAENYAMDMIDNAFKKISKKNKNSVIQFKVNKTKKKEENPIRATIDDMEISEFPCCNRTAKIRYILKYSGSYCPFCGGKQDGNN
ncbi:MAG: TFIIB-type zinc ribbon-containing protein [Tyzzerella sp.]|nr:TFIIB-type zinc ribbon-containing protein [Tyzzerella sp.]